MAYSNTQEGERIGSGVQADLDCVREGGGGERIPPTELQCRPVLDGIQGLTHARPAFYH